MLEFLLNKKNSLYIFSEFAWKLYNYITKSLYITFFYYAEHYFLVQPNIFL